MTTCWNHPLLDVLRDGRRLAGLTPADWNGLLVYARGTNLLPRVEREVEEQGLAAAVPEQVQAHLVSARVQAERHERVVRWEVKQVEAALADLDTPVVLLKGAAYLMAGLPSSHRRYYSDVDILVEKEKLEQVEGALLSHGWAVAALDPLDQRYFRRWLHELPPLVHRRRRTTLDVHHAILPRTDKLRVDPRRLFATARAIEGSRLMTLGQAEMVLHSAAHLFRNGNFTQGLRDLADIDGMLRHFAADPDFWQRLLGAAEELDLRLPCFCGLRYARRAFQTPIPPHVEQAVARWRPRWFALPLIDRLVERATLPRRIDQVDQVRELAIDLLSHWPVPRLKAMASTLFWTKRLPKLRPAGRAVAP